MQLGFSTFEIQIRLWKCRADGIAPRVALFAECIRLVRHFLREIVCFGKVVTQVVKLDVIVLEKFQQLPLARADGALGRGRVEEARVVEKESGAIEL